MLRALLLALLCLIPACSRPPGQAGHAPPLVLVEVAPLKSLVEPLLAQGIEVRSIVPAGVSPHAYQLTPDDAAALARAQLVITVSPDLDPAITRNVDHLVPAERRIDIAGMLAITPSATDDAHNHADDAHDHGTIDPHLWLDPVLMHAFIERLEPDLVRRNIAHPDHAGYRATLLAAIDSIDNSYKTELAPFAGRAIITHHDAFRRVADRYGLTVAQVIRPVTTVEPTPGDLTSAADAVRAAHAGAIFVEPQFSLALPQRLADQLGVRLITLDPVATDDWFDTMRLNLRALVEGLSAPPADGAPETDPG